MKCFDQFDDLPTDLKVYVLFMYTTVTMTGNNMIIYMKDWDV